MSEAQIGGRIVKELKRFKRPRARSKDQEGGRTPPYEGIQFYKRHNEEKGRGVKVFQFGAGEGVCGWAIALGGRGESKKPVMEGSRSSRLA